MFSIYAFKRLDFCTLCSEKEMRPKSTSSNLMNFLLNFLIFSNPPTQTPSCGMHETA